MTSADCEAIGLPSGLEVHQHLFTKREERNIGIVQLGLEDASSREVSDAGDPRVFLTGSFAVPLVEPVTRPTTE